MTPELQKQIAAYVEAEVRRRKLPATAYAVIAGGQVVMSAGLGATADGQPVTPDTLFQVGSVTKSVTVTAVLQLRDQGLINLDAPVREYLPWFQLADAAAAQAVTVRHLLNQVSVIPNGAWKIALNDPAIMASIEQGVRASGRIKPAGAPGKSWMYSNINYNILGLLVEVIAGRPYQEYVTAAIFRPLGRDGPGRRHLVRPLGPGALVISGRPGRHGAGSDHGGRGQDRHGPDDVCLASATASAGW